MSDLTKILLRLDPRATLFPLADEVEYFLEFFSRSKELNPGLAAGALCEILREVTPAFLRADAAYRSWVLLGELLGRPVQWNDVAEIQKFLWRDIPLDLIRQRLR